MLALDGAMREYPRLAGLSSFGAGGANAHVIVEEYRAPVERQVYQLPEGQAALVVLSAKNAERLDERVSQLLAAIGRGEVSDANLADAAYTLQVGREAMEVRLALAVKTVEELSAGLRAVLAGDTDLDGVYRGEVKRRSSELAALSFDEDMATTIDSWIRKGKSVKLLELWANGFAFDWNRLYGDIKPRRLPLPTYPFERERAWIPAFSETANWRGDLPGRLPALSRDRKKRFDSAFFEKLFKDVDDDLLSVEGALAEAYKRTSETR